MGKSNWISTKDDPGWMPQSHDVAVKDENGDILEGTLEMDDVGNSNDDEYPIWAFIAKNGEKYSLYDFEEFSYLE